VPTGRPEQSYGFGIKFADFAVGGATRIDAYIDTADTQNGFVVENANTRLKPKTNKASNLAYFAFDSGFAATLWTAFQPIVNAISGDGGTPLFKVYWSNDFYDVDNLNDRKTLNGHPAGGDEAAGAPTQQPKWIGGEIGAAGAGWYSANDVNAIVFTQFGEVRARYMYVRVKLDASGSQFPTLAASPDFLWYRLPFFYEEDVNVVLDGVSPFVEVRALRGQKRFVTFTFQDVDGDALDLTDVPVQVFMRDRDDFAVGGPRAVEVLNGPYGEAQYEFTQYDTDLEPGRYTVEVIAWRPSNFVRREFTLVVETTAVPAFHDPEQLVADFAGPVSID
jgi:hypothetical protein